MEQRSGRQVQAVETSCRILQFLQYQTQTSVTEIADQVGCSKSTTHCHLRTLTDCGLIVKEDNQYRLSYQFIGIAEQVRSQLGNYRTIKDETDRLAESTQEVAQFGIEEQGKVTYIYKQKSENGVETASGVGETQDIHSTGLGKAILSSLPNERVRKVIDKHGLSRKTKNTITDHEALFEELQQIRERGYAIDDEENVEGIRCIAAPVNWGANVGAVSITGPTSRIRNERLEGELSDQIRHTANVIEVNSRFQ